MTETKNIRVQPEIGGGKRTNKQSAGILFYRFKQKSLEVLLVHPGGPFHVKRDIGAWSVPKGEFSDGEEPLDAAIREVKEELGVDAAGPFTELTPIIQKSGKKVFAWALEKDINTTTIVSNTIPVEWPPRSGKFIQVPEVDRAEWFLTADAIIRVIPAQAGLLKELERILADSQNTPA